MTVILKTEQQWIQLKEFRWILYLAGEPMFMKPIAFSTNIAWRARASAIS